MRLQSCGFPLAVAIMSFIAPSQSNPSDTADQRMLDGLAVRLHQQHHYDDLISEAHQHFSFVASQHGYDMSSIALKSTLSLAVSELAFSSMQKAVNDDPAHPRVYSLLNPPRESVPGGRYAYDNPDAIYFTIPISNLYDYEIRGKRSASGPADSSFSLISNVSIPTNIAVLAGQDLVVESDGSFIITINSTTSSSPNHIQSDSRAVQLFIRNNIANWAIQAPDNLEVEIRSADQLPEELSEDEIIEKSRRYFSESILAYGSVLLGDLTLSRPQNLINAPSQRSFGTLATQANSFSHYNLSEADAIVMTFDAGAANYWIVPTTTLWMITDQPGERLESLNVDQAIANENGTYTIVISTVDPGVHNWITTMDGGIGTIMSRFQGFPAGETKNSGIQLWSQVVPVESLKDILPDERMWISREERDHQLKKRRESYTQLRSF